jgi:hypothetical protein
MRASFLVGVVAAGLFLTATGASAHHSFSMFDGQTERSLTGVVKDFQYTNPHSFVQLDVRTKSGNILEWSIEMSAPGALTKAGIVRDTFKIGDQVDVRIHPLRDGTAGGSFISASLPNGKVVTSSQVAVRPAS